jgi:hypothetical protein
VGLKWWQYGTAIGLLCSTWGIASAEVRVGAWPEAVAVPELHAAGGSSCGPAATALPGAAVARANAATMMPVPRRILLVMTFPFVSRDLRSHGVEPMFGALTLEIGRCLPHQGNPQHCIGGLAGSDRIGDPMPHADGTQHQARSDIANVSNAEATRAFGNGGLW